MKDSKLMGSGGQRASIVQVRARKLPDTNSGEKQMSCLNMKPKSESLYRWTICVHPSFVLLFFLKRIPNLFFCDFHPQGG